jgi:hypothetical protein
MEIALERFEKDLLSQEQLKEKSKNQIKSAVEKDYK